MDNTAVIRLSVFLGVFVLMAVLEALLPAREAVLSRKTRWLGNLSMVVMGALVSRILLPATLVGVSLWAQQKGIGVFNVLLDAVPVDASSSNQLLNSGEPLSNSSAYLVHIAIVTLSVLLLDMLIYWQHRLFHTVPMLWRFHKMHHADSHVDTTTGLRFHPVEIAMSLGIKAAAVVMLGVPAIAIVIFEVALNGFALFNHANIRLPQKWDDRIGLVLITQR
ncbi:MAG: sterol desaturase family protein, partial [Pseudomonadota bacterium]|nr:sterol desaturase family protein [Pseudomonadota bacterium]